MVPIRLDKSPSVAQSHWVVSRLVSSGCSSPVRLNLYGSDFLGFDERELFPTLHNFAIVPSRALHQCVEEDRDRLREDSNAAL